MGLRVAVLLALVVATATVAAGAPLSAPTDGADAVAEPAPQQTASASVAALPNSTNYLTVGDGGSARFGNASLDVASATAVETGRQETRLVEGATIQAFESADNDTMRTAVLERASRDLENRTVALERRHERAIAQFTAGQRSTGAFLREVAVVDARASELQTTGATLLRTARQAPGYSLPIGVRTRLESLEAGPVLLQGPVRSTAGQAIVGSTDSAAVYVEATDDGVVLARITEDRFVRETYRSGTPRSGEDTFSENGQAPINTAYERARTLYPWAVSNGITTPSANGYGNTPVYRITLDHTQGQLVSYLDGTSGDVAREIQEQRLSRLPVQSNRTNATAELRLVANLTHTSGPMALTVRDPVTNETVDARVRVDDQFVGTTGADGRLWTVQPPGVVTVQARTAANETATVRLTG